MRFLLLLSFTISLNIFAEPENDFYLECKDSFSWFENTNEKHIFFYSKDTKELKWHRIIQMGKERNYHVFYPLHFSGESTYIFRSKKKYDRSRWWNDWVNLQKRSLPNDPQTMQLKKKSRDIQYNFLHLNRKELTIEEIDGLLWERTHKCRKIWYLTYLWKTRNDGKPKEKEKPNRI